MRFGTLTLLSVTLAVDAGCAVHGARTTTLPPALALVSGRAPVSLSEDARAGGGNAAHRPPSRASQSRASQDPAPPAQSAALQAASSGGDAPANPSDGAAASSRTSATSASANPSGGARVTPAMGLSGEGPRVGSARALANPADVSGVWIWEHRGPVPTGDEKQEREEWHVDQQGDRISGYYDRVVREISTDGHAFRCSMGLEFEIATRYRIRGEVRGNQVLIYESSFEVLAPSACDNGQRRLDAYEGLASDDEVRLAWGVGAQVLRRPRPDVPTQHF